MEIDVGAPEAPDGELLEEGLEAPIDLSTWTGYDPDFLGDPVPLPVPGDAVADDVLVWTDAATGEDRTALDYPHYSVVMSVARKLARFTALNCDADQRHDGLTGGRKSFTFDKRIETGQQVGDAIYGERTQLDRGHLARREDAEWGETEDLARAASRATHYFTNCSPQHRKFNQGAQTWRKVEDHILDQIATDSRRVTVFTGPVLSPNDRSFEGVPLPREFWKVVVAVHPLLGFHATGFLLSQAELIPEAVADPDNAEVYGALSEFQVTIVEIETLTNLDFGALRRFDPLTRDLGPEAVAPAVPLTSLADILL